MDTSIAYWTRTGHSRKIAEHIGNTLKLPVHNLREGPPPRGHLVLVSGIYAGKCDPKMLNALQALTPDTTPRLTLVITCASPDARDADLRKALASQGLAVDEKEHVCPGGFLFIRFTRPNQRDLDAAAGFVKEAIKQA